MNILFWKNAVALIIFAPVRLRIWLLE